MTDEQARALFMDYLYDEISDEDCSELKSYLKNRPQLQRELDELQKTRSLLQQMPETASNKKLLIVESEGHSFKQWWSQAKQILPKSRIGKTAFAAAAGLILLLVVGSLARLQIDTSANGVRLSMGYPSSNSEDALTKQQVESILAQYQKENAAMLSEYVKEINRQNKQQIQQAVNYFQKKRLHDLQLVEQTFDELQQKTNYRFRQTNEYLGEVLQTVSYRNKD